MKFFRKLFCFMDAYRISGIDGNSLNSKMIEYAVHKYRGSCDPTSDIRKRFIVTYKTHAYALPKLRGFFYDKIETNSKVKM